MSGSGPSGSYADRSGPPAENRLPVAIETGEKSPLEHGGQP
ncbi:hypothetical protein PV664_27925 [Streptomyces sp. ME01-18a]|nr:hypothetical protein [Streptomyces sp. ME01-18a]MDX3432745.1 hypothetical protein [Streptomyces sp. ME01-18a]